MRPRRRPLNPLDQSALGSCPSPLPGVAAMQLAFAPDAVMVPVEPVGIRAGDIDRPLDVRGAVAAPAGAGVVTRGKGCWSGTFVDRPLNPPQWMFNSRGSPGPGGAGPCAL